MPKRPKSKIKSFPPPPFWKKAVPFLVLTASFLFCFRDWSHFTSQIFLSMDSSALYYPLVHWSHRDLAQGRLPLISDMAYHGAPLAAICPSGVLSPVLWWLQSVSSTVLATNLVFIAPFPIFLLGSYFLGRSLKLSASASILLAFLWTYNGQRMAQLDHWNVAWACAFFPWAFLSLVRYREGGTGTWLLLSGFFWGFNLLSGHPQIFFLEALFFLFYALFAPPPRAGKPKWVAVLMMALVAGWTASPLLLHLGECLSLDGLRLQWNETDRFFHSWTPLNFITLLFPWFFGKYQYDGQGLDYWWQYQFVEMQVAFSIAGLFFILLFFSLPHPQRRWIGITALFGLSMALGKFFFVYPLVQRLPGFSFFRDPARYWFLITWAIGLGAAYAWEEWFQGKRLHPTGRKWAAGLCLFSAIFLGLVWFFLALGRPLVESAASWAIQRFLLGDSLHTQPLSTYLNRLSEKLEALALNLDLFRSRVFLPLSFLAGLLLAVFNRGNWNLNFQKGFLLTLVFIDLMAFRMPLGRSFYTPSEIGTPRVPPAESRALPFIYHSVWPLPRQYAELAFPNMNFVFERPSLIAYAYPPLDRYAQLSSAFGWFSWVYKSRDTMGFTRHPNLLRALGVDQIISDVPLALLPPFQAVQKSYPYVYRLSPVLPKAYLVDRFRLGSWPDSVNLFEKPDFKPLHEAVLDSLPGFPSSPVSRSLDFPSPKILKWEETRLSLSAQIGRACLLILQKTFLPGWKARVNGNPVQPLRCDLVLTAVPLSAGDNQVELFFQPAGLQLGFFLFLLLSGIIAFSLFRLLLA